MSMEDAFALMSGRLVADDST